MGRRIKGMACWLIGIVLLAVLDQYTKQLAVNTLKGKTPFVLVEGVFEFLYYENRGAAFGMLQGKQGFFFVIAVVVCGMAGYFMWKMTGTAGRRYIWLEICATILSAGAIGNMIDRTVQGYVVDFLYFKLINFPIFNVADIYVTTSAVGLILLLCFVYKEEELQIFQWRQKESES